MKLAEIEARLDSVRANPPQDHGNLSGTPGSSTYVGSEPSPETAPGTGPVRARGDMWVDGRAASDKMTFPAVLFLDSDVYRWTGTPRPNPNLDIPMVSVLF
jgi:hypothetical protein